MHRVFDYLYEEDYPDSCSYDFHDAVMSACEHGDTEYEPSLAGPSDEYMNLCHLHSSVYFLADKYLIPGLKELCLNKFEECCQKDVVGMESALDPKVVRQIFEESSETTKPLRNTLVAIICENATNAELKAQINTALAESNTMGSLMALALMEKVAE